MVRERSLSNVERWRKAHSPEGDQYDWKIVAEDISMDVLEQTMGILKEKEKNQSWLAQQIGVHRARISYLFTARPNMKLETIGRIAAALKVRPKIILDRDRYEITPRVVDGEKHESETDDVTKNNNLRALIWNDATGTKNGGGQQVRYETVSGT